MSEASTREERQRRHLYDEMRRDTPRAARARRFSQMVHAMLRDFLPVDRDCARRVDEYLTEIGFENNAEIISVPPECDALDKLVLERRMLETRLNAVNAEQRVADLLKGLTLAISYIDHMAAFIEKANSDYHCGVYSFEGLGEDMPGLRKLAQSGRPAEGDH